MTLTQTYQLTNLDTAKRNDLTWRLREVKRRYDAAPSGSPERKALGALGRKLHAELNGGK